MLPLSKIVRVPLATVLIIGLIGCGGSSSDNAAANSANSQIDQSSNTNTGSNTVDTPEMPAVFAIDIQRETDSTPAITDVRYLPESAGVYRPLGAITGEYMALAYVGADIVDAVAVRFPTEFRSESLSEDFLSAGGESVAFNTAAQTTRIHLDATKTVERIDIIQSDGTVVATVSEPQKDTAQLTRGTRGIFSNYPWITLLDATDTHPTLLEMAPGGLITLSQAEQAVVKGALDELPKRLVSAISSIGFGVIQNDPTKVGLAYGGHFILSPSMLTAPKGYLVWQTMHEAGHAYHNLSAATAGARDFSEWVASWPANAVTAVRETHKQFNYDADILTYWNRLHANAVEGGLARPYQGSGSNLSSPVDSGFVSSYAASNPSEDFADTVVIANLKIMNDINSSTVFPTCTAFQQLSQMGENLPKEKALAYIKLRQIQAMGLATQANLDWCMGAIVPTKEKGIHLDNQFLFDVKLNAGYTGTDRAQFNIVGQDSESRGLAIELGTQGKHPVGVYPLDVTWWGFWDGSNSLVVASPIDFEAMTAVSGTVVVTHADSSDRVDGFVYDLLLLNAVGIPTYFAYAPFRIPL